MEKVNILENEAGTNGKELLREYEMEHPVRNNLIT
jgi:hypothetical protein